MSDAIHLGILLLVFCLVAPILGGLVKLYLIHKSNREKTPSKDGEVNDQLWRILEKEHLWTGKIIDDQD